ncbi:hypothetical protein BH11PLA2_BH11PLA2_35720 [soil metagenome]
MTRQTHSRHGFSLIELLVVIALLSLLAALSVGTFFRIRSGQLVSATETTMQKLNTGLDRIWSAERDRAEKEFVEKKLPNGIQVDSLLVACGGSNEVDRAKAVWMLMRMKLEFPQTFAQARTNVTVLGTIVLPARTTFQVVPNTAPTTADEANLQAAALLYLILSEKGSRGEIFDVDSLNAWVKPITVNGYTGKCFVDAYGTPITYARFLTNEELNEAPYTKIPTVTATTSNNPFDPKGRLSSASIPAWTNRASFNTLSGITDADMKKNFMATVISAGPNRVWDGLNVNTTGLVTYTVNATTNATSDNLMGYRLRKLGARGD